MDSKTSTTPPRSEDTVRRVAALPERVREIVSGPGHRDAKLVATVKAIREAAPHYTWVGIYLLEKPAGREQELVLHNFIGRPTPHVRIPLDQGICGAAVRDNETLIVDDVNADPRYLACSIETKSEIVVPIRDARGAPLGELDLDSDTTAAFDARDRAALEHVANLLGPVLA
jgi:GAF domain-containing protein